MSSVMHGTDVVEDNPQPFGLCNSCLAGMVMLHSNGVLECENCEHKFSYLVDGTPTKNAASITEDEDSWF